MNDPAVLAEVEAVFARYERALADNDIAALDGFFWQSPAAVRFGVGEALYGFAAISAFRAGRAGGSPTRSLVNEAVLCFGTDFAVTNTEFVRNGETRRGRQSQVWVRIPEIGWRIVSAHVSLMAETS